MIVIVIVIVIATEVELLLYKYIHIYTSTRLIVILILANTALNNYQTTSCNAEHVFVDRRGLLSRIRRMSVTSRRHTP